MAGTLADPLAMEDDGAAQVMQVIGERTRRMRTIALGVLVPASFALGASLVVLTYGVQAELFGEVYASALAVSFVAPFFAIFHALPWMTGWLVDARRETWVTELCQRHALSPDEVRELIAVFR